jgi:tetratricopeptide (TPR) repeat protein
VTHCAGVVLASVLVLAGAARSEAPALPTAAGFEETARRADLAREQGRLEEAAAFYREAVALRPQWGEGWWYLGTLAYEADRHRECRDTLARLVALDPGIGAAWGFRGLCEFALGEHDAAGRHLDRAVQTGPVAEEPMWRVVLYHQALLRIRAGEFERAIPPLRQIAQAGEWPPDILDACGLRLLRRATLPAEVPASDRALVRMAGRAECATLAGRRDAAESAFRELLSAHPRERHLHYGYGVYLAGQGSREATDAHRREVELFPDHALAHVELAFNLLTHGRSEEAKGAARAAVRLEPAGFAGHLALGRALVDTGDLARGIPALETAARLAPGSPEVHLALARAYARAGRRADADRANARFRELEELRRRRSAVVGSSPPPEKP